MLYITDFYRAIKTALKNTFKNIPVQIKDKKNPRPPCFYIQVLNPSSTQCAAEFKEQTFTFVITYFSGPEKLLDLLEIQSKLEELFEKPLKVCEFKKEDINFIEINDIDFSLNENDYILECTLTYSVIQRFIINQHDRYEFPEDHKGIPQDSRENIEEISIKRSIKK